MSYPSIISQPGSAQRNLQPIIDALSPLLDADKGSKQSRILELASYPYEHISSFAQRWPEVEWQGTCRDDKELQHVQEKLFASGSSGEAGPSSNLRPPRRLDVSDANDWNDVFSHTTALWTDGPVFGGVIALNLIHCCPSDVPENIFRHLSPRSDKGRKLLDPMHGWIAAYGPYKNDDGSYKSPADQEFDKSYIKAEDDSLGLRTIQSITVLAEKWGFVEESRREMPKGNMWVVWRVEG